MKELSQQEKVSIRKIKSILTQTIMDIKKIAKEARRSPSPGRKTLRGRPPTKTPLRPKEKVLQFIVSQGSATLTSLSRGTQAMKSGERAKALRSLVKKGLIIQTEQRTGERGRAAVVYRPARATH